MSEPRIYTAAEWRVAISKTMMRLVQCVAERDLNAFKDVDLGPVIQMSEAKPHCRGGSLPADKEPAGG